MAICRVPLPKTPPPDDETNGDHPCCGSPISLANGNTFIAETDINMPGLGGGLHLARRWNSVWPQDEIAKAIGLFGPQWRSTYEEYVFLGNYNYMKYARADGSFWSFGYDSDAGAWRPAAPANESASLVQGPTTWTLTFKNGETRVFDSTTGNLLSIADRNGNTTQLSYDGTNRLTTVTDAAGRSLTFSYGSPNSFLVTGVTSSVGSYSVSYSYDAQNRLKQVTYPDQSTLNFAYDANSLISSVTDSQGKVLESHTYDIDARGLTSSRANGVDAVTITYPVTYNPASLALYDPGATVGEGGE
jgi:YD repeat-containing protein